MPRAGLSAFALTTAVLAPVLLLHAGKQQVGRLFAGDHNEMTVGKLKVEAAADHLVVDPGQKLHIKLTGTADEHARAKVAVLVYEQRGMGKYRNDLPPTLIDETEVTLDADKAAPASRDVVFALPADTRGGDMAEGNWVFGHYTVLVMTPEEANKLHRLKRGSDEHEQSALASAMYDYDHTPSEGETSAIARMDVFTRAVDSAVAIHAPDRASVNADIPVEVRVTNPNHHKVSEVSVKLDTTPFGEVSRERHTFRGLDAELTTVTPSDAQTIDLAAGQTKTVTFHVTAKGAGVLGLFARTECSNEDCYGKATKVSLSDGAIDAIDIEGADAGKEVVTARAP